MFAIILAWVRSRASGPVPLQDLSRHSSSKQFVVQRQKGDKAWVPNQKYTLEADDRNILSDDVS